MPLKDVVVVLVVVVVDDFIVGDFVLSLVLLYFIVKPPPFAAICVKKAHFRFGSALCIVRFWRSFFAYLVCFFAKPPFWFFLNVASIDH